MYLLVSLADVVQIHPSEFNKPSARAIEDYINTKYADKVIHKVGLCLGFHSIISSSEGLIGHGTGIVNVNVDFRLMVYRPFKGEIVLGTITHSNPRAGIYLSQDFFEDIVVPPETLFEGTSWGKDDQGVEAFIWRSKNEATGDENEFFFDRAENCLYRVEDEQWRDLSPQMQKNGQDFLMEDAIDDGELRKTPYLIRGSMMFSGLGLTMWWTGEGLDGEEDA
ncbi:DNA-directed RNA polymerase III complex subunit Rpc25 [Vermiconidia calcicola]|uniref:DNA-directed RNA polymerase III complex subunit Rpc25 n=1 Tax=Vermiconidia calcicola TaxID=1690605 RepID=A0ACC3MFJ9_9PEZI|nr:DNA-directed RNA polymerase III complex subunit Rpc25 [Vermiconidia calcicola]